VLYEATPYGYRARPSQEILRFGNRVSYDERGLRSEPVADRPPPGVLRVLCLGDSITNGGTLTDQHDTYPYRLAERLRALRGPVEVLNASAGGWALANAAGWLEANGTLHSALVVLGVASHDLFQPPAPAAIVDAHPSFPSRPPRLALAELAVRYALPRLGLAAVAADPGVGERVAADVGPALAALERIRGQVAASGATLVLLLIEQPLGLEPADDATVAAKAALRRFAGERGIPLVAPAPLIEAGGGARLFRDGLHPGPAGNDVIAAAVADALARLAPASG
jgi:lysophospholipase L1-like esterase